MDRMGRFPGPPAGPSNIPRPINTASAATTAATTAPTTASNYQGFDGVWFDDLRVVTRPPERKKECLRGTGLDLQELSRRLECSDCGKLRADGTRW